MLHPEVAPEVGSHRNTGRAAPSRVGPRRHLFVDAVSSHFFVSPHLQHLRHRHNEMHSQPTSLNLYVADRKIHFVTIRNEAAATVASSLRRRVSCGGGGGSQSSFLPADSITNYIALNKGYTNTHVRSNRLGKWLINDWMPRKSRYLEKHPSCCKKSGGTVRSTVNGEASDGSPTLVSSSISSTPRMELLLYNTVHHYDIWSPFAEKKSRCCIITGAMGYLLQYSISNPPERKTARRLFLHVQNGTLLYARGGLPLAAWYHLHVLYPLLHVYCTPWCLV